MSVLPERSLTRSELMLGCAIYFVIGVATMIYLQGPGLTSPSKYHGDLTQSPHWVAYHGDRFAQDDLLVEYATYNESPVQNAIYWVGTLLIDVVMLNKVVGITIFGLTAALFFALVAQMSGPRAGVLAALFFIIFPRSTYEIAGGFSKAWAIGFILVAVYLVETRTWWILLWVMPLGALAYPTAAVMVGFTISSTASVMGRALAVTASSWSRWYRTTRAVIPPPSTAHHRCMTRRKVPRMTHPWPSMMLPPPMRIQL